MINSRFKSVLIAVLLVFTVMNCSFVQAQGSKKPILLSKDGVGVVMPDSQFSVNFKFRIQPRMGFVSDDENIGDIELFDFRIRRMRLKFNGFLFSPKLTYKAEFGFSRSDMTFDGTGNPSALLDGMIFYSPIKNLSIGMGQGKLPGNRSRVVSSGNMHFGDRSIVNNAYTIDRDDGFFASYKFNVGKTPILILKGAVTGGEGRGVGNTKEFSKAETPNAGLSYSGRVEFLPFGAFTNKGDYFEGDLEREKSPKLSIGGGYNYNDQAIRTGGQLGKALYQTRSFSGTHFDLMFKYMGLAVTSEYINRRMDVGQKTFTYRSATDSNYVLVGSGLNTEISYTFKNMWEIATRYAYTNPDKSLWNVKKDGEKNEEYALAFVKYINGHEVKVVNEFSYFKRSSMITGEKSSGSVGFRVQLEMGF